MLFIHPENSVGEPVQSEEKGNVKMANMSLISSSSLMQSIYIYDTTLTFHESLRNYTYIGLSLSLHCFIFARITQFYFICMMVTVSINLYGSKAPDALED